MLCCCGCNLSKSFIAVDNWFIAGEAMCICQAVLSPEMQHSFAESNLSSSSLSSDKAHVDEGYHSNMLVFREITMSEIAVVFVMQMQFLVSRLASPTLVDFDEDGRNDALSLDDQITLPQPFCIGVLPFVGAQQQRDCVEKFNHDDVPDCSLTSGQQQKCAGPQAACADRFCNTSVSSVVQQQDAQKTGIMSVLSISRQQDLVDEQTDCAQLSSHGNIPAVVELQLDCTALQCATADESCSQTIAGLESGMSCGAAVSSDTESTMSLNELLDGCPCASDAAEMCDTDECSQAPTVSHLSEIINMLHVSVDPDSTHTDSILPISDNSPARLDIKSSQPSTFSCSGEDVTGHARSMSMTGTQTHADCQAVLSPDMQRSFAESNLSSSSLSSDKAHVDEGYHSNATSALSHDATTYDDANSMMAAVLSVAV